MKKPFILSSLVVALALSQGCAGYDIPSAGAITGQEAFDRAVENMDISKKEVADESVFISSEPFIQSKAQPSARAFVRGDLAINVSDVNFHQLIYEVANNYGISTIVAQDVDISIDVSVNLKNESPVSAIKAIARAAGYVAVYNFNNNSVTIAPRAVYTFKVPVSIMEILGEGESLVSVENLEVGAATGKVVGDIQTRLGAMLGDSSKISIFSQSGIITVEGDIYTLDLAHDFLNRYIEIASSSLNIRAAVISININESNKKGVNWAALFDSGADVSVSDGDFTEQFFRSSGQTPEGGFVINLSSKKLGVILDLLDNETNFEILSQPQLSVTNLQSAALFSGSQVPYLSEISSITADDGDVTTTRTTETANDGVLLQVTGDILDKKHVQMRVQPSVTSIRGYAEFGAGSDLQRVPIEDVSTSNSVITIESGQTIILGGVRTSEVSLETTSINDTVSNLFGLLVDSTQDELIQKEFWILLNVAIAESVATESLIGEAVSYAYSESE